jgi:hypothetical protein
MSSWSAEIRRFEAAQRRNEREAKRRQKELERRIKEQAKLSAFEQARLEVEAHENALEVLLSVHKEQSATVDWRALARALPPHKPLRLARHELAAFSKQALSQIFPSVSGGEARLEEARSLDEREHEAAWANYEREFAQWQKLNSLARRVLVGEARAYTQAVSDLSARIAEISNLGSSIHMTVHEATLIECELKVKGRDVIPADTKSLTAAGKVAVKVMPKARFDEIYQGYVCGCVLRLAREMLALLPVETALITATVDGIDSRTGHPAELPVLSIAAPRAVIERLDFEHLDPADALENFQHRGDVMASRKSGGFVPIIPLTPANLNPTRPETMDFASLVSRVRQFRIELDACVKPVMREPSSTTARNDVVA